MVLSAMHSGPKEEMRCTFVTLRDYISISIYVYVFCLSGKIGLYIYTYIYIPLYDHDEIREVRKENKVFIFQST